MHRWLEIVTVSSVDSTKRTNILWTVPTHILFQMYVPDLEFIPQRDEYNVKEYILSIWSLECDINFIDIIIFL